MVRAGPSLTTLTVHEGPNELLTPVSSKKPGRQEGPKGRAPLAVHNSASQCRLADPRVEPGIIERLPEVIVLWLCPETVGIPLHGDGELEDHWLGGTVDKEAGKWGREAARNSTKTRQVKKAGREGF